jgi:hypothetical protein
MKNLPSKNSQRNYTFLTVFSFVTILFAPIMLHSQENNSIGYRNIDAYIADFAKNEMYVKKSLIEYSNSIIDNQLESRSLVTSIKITEKLKNINTILKRYDKGFNRDITIRDGFIKMNSKTIECLNNGTLILNDYEAQTLNPVSAILENLDQKEINLISYFDALRDYDESKKEFGSKQNINIKTLEGRNVFEYNAYQNILFYKMNVMDQKLISSILKVDKKGFTESINAFDAIYKEVILKTTLYKGDYNDDSLNNANIAFAQYTLDANAKIKMLFADYANEYNALQLLKASKNADTKESIAIYNKRVRSYNLIKNKLFDVMSVTQANKKTLYNNWFTTNRTFLKRNIKMDDIHENYTSTEITKS